MILALRLYQSCLSSMTNTRVLMRKPTEARTRDKITPESSRNSIRTKYFYWVDLWTRVQKTGDPLHLWRILNASNRLLYNDPRHEHRTLTRRAKG